MIKKHSTKVKKDNLDNQIIKLKDEIKELKLGWQRTQADFDNFRKKSEDEKLENMAFAKAEFMTKLTPVLDNFYRAFSHAKTNDPTVQGFLQIQKQLEDILTSEGLQKISSSAGTKFDPNFHEALAMEASQDIPENRVMVEYEKGYLYKDRLLRAAKVVVSKGDVQPAS